MMRKDTNNVTRQCDKCDKQVQTSPYDMKNVDTVPGNAQQARKHPIKCWIPLNTKIWCHIV